MHSPFTVNKGTRVEFAPHEEGLPKIARKAGHWQTAYSAVLQAQECHAPFTSIQSAKLVKASGEPLRALYELDNAINSEEEYRLPKHSQGIKELTYIGFSDSGVLRRLEGKVNCIFCIRQWDAQFLKIGQTIACSMDERVRKI